MSLMASTAVISFYLKTNCAKLSEMKKRRKGGQKDKVQERQRALGSHRQIKSLFMGYYKHLFHFLADTQWKIRMRHYCSVSSSVESPGKAWNCPQQDTTLIHQQLTVSDWLIRICLEMQNQALEGKIMCGSLNNGVTRSYAFKKPWKVYGTDSV